MGLNCEGRALYSLFRRGVRERGLGPFGEERHP